MIRLIEHDLLVGPIQAVIAGCVADVPLVGRGVQYFKEQGSCIAYRQQKGVSNEARLCIQNILSGEYGVRCARYWRQLEGGCALIDPNGPLDCEALERRKQAEDRKCRAENTVFH